MTTLSARRFSLFCLAGCIGLAASAASFEALADSFNGQVVFRNTLEVRAGVSGRVDSAALVPGSEFEKGQELAVIERGLYGSRLNNAEQRLVLLRAEYEEAEKAFERNQILFEEGSLSLVDFDHARLMLERARTELRQAETDMVTARHHHDLATARAPFDGVVLDRLIAAGQYVNAQIEAPVIAIIAERGKFAVRFGIEAAKRKSLEPGASATVTIDGRGIAGTVGAVRLAGSAEQRSWIVDVNFDDDSEQTVAGLDATVDMP